MSALVCIASSSKLEKGRRHPGSVRELARRHAVTFAVAGVTTARSPHSSFQSTEDLPESGLTS